MKNKLYIMTHKFIFCLLFILNGSALADNIKDQQNANAAIKKLEKLHFLYKDGISLTLLSKNSIEKENDNKVESNNKHDDSKTCADSIAKLQSSKSAIYLENSNKILAILSCPSDDYISYSVLALFNIEQINKPLCYSRVNIMDDENIYYWGGIKSIEHRIGDDKSIYAVATVEGGDGGVNWISKVFFRTDNHCKSTVLARFYEDAEFDVCSFTLSHRFTSDVEATIYRKPFYCKRNQKPPKRPLEEKINLQEMYVNKNLRILF